MKKIENGDTYLIKVLENNFNNEDEDNKREFLKKLNTQGTFIEACKEKGFVYELNLVAFDQEIQIKIGLKNGLLSIHNLVCLNPYDLAN